jgi:hypothetical protein
LLSTHVTMVFATPMANFWISTPFLAELCIFPSPTTFVTKYFDLARKKWNFHFISGRKRQNMWFFVKWLPREVWITLPIQFSYVGDLVGRLDPRFEELSWHAAIYWIIFELNPFKFKFELGVHKLRFKKIAEKYLEVP